MNADKHRWTLPSDVRARLHKAWQRGTFLSQSAEYPYRLPIKGPRSTEMTSDFESVRQWIDTWQNWEKTLSVDSVKIDWESWNHRVFGVNQKPIAVIFPHCPSILQILHVTKEWKVFQTLLLQTQTQLPALLPWVGKYPMRALELALSDKWEKLLNVVLWIQAHPQSNLYLRQVDIPGIDSKFIESHYHILTKLLDEILPSQADDSHKTGVAAFVSRYGFRDKPERIRFRFLDEMCAIESKRLGLDLTLRIEAFAQLYPDVENVFITENEINFLAFPDHPKSLVIFGSGYGWSTLRTVPWLSFCKIYYWGDIDTHGFSILNQLRAYFPQVVSFLMDLPTLQACQESLVTEHKPTTGILTHLTQSEQETFAYLQDHPGTRLEQESIPFSLLQKILQRL